MANFASQIRILAFGRILLNFAQAATMGSCCCRRKVEQDAPAVGEDIYLEDDDSDEQYLEGGNYGYESSLSEEGDPLASPVASPGHETTEDMAVSLTSTSLMLYEADKEDDVKVIRKRVIEGEITLRPHPQTSGWRPGFPGFLTVKPQPETERLPQQPCPSLPKPTVSPLPCPPVGLEINESKAEPELECKPQTTTRPPANLELNIRLAPVPAKPSEPPPPGLKVEVLDPRCPSNFRTTSSTDNEDTKTRRLDTELNFKS